MTAVGPVAYPDTYMALYITQIIVVAIVCSKPDRNVCVTMPGQRVVKKGIKLSSNMAP